MRIRDDRTYEQELTHTCLIVGMDRILSGWGKAKGGKSLAAWACEPKNKNKVLKWVRNRGDIIDIQVFNDYVNPVGPGDCHIYVVTENHPSLR